MCALLLQIKICILLDVQGGRAIRMPSLSYKTIWTCTLPDTLSKAFDWQGNNTLPDRNPGSPCAYYHNHLHHRLGMQAAVHSKQSAWSSCQMDPILASSLQLQRAVVLATVVLSMIIPTAIAETQMLLWKTSLRSRKLPVGVIPLMWSLASFNILCS